jgi:hypothetical protein
MEQIKVSRCEDFFGFQKDAGEVCPLSWGSHCSIDGTLTSVEIPVGCPLRNKPIKISLKKSGGFIGLLLKKLNWLKERTI